jgi:predicted RNase H-like nuclease (RuvC/YqgF family)
MAQDFHSAFPLNDNDKMLNDADMHGVALAAIQGLNMKLQEKDAEIQELKGRLDKLERALSSSVGNH